MKKEIDHIVEQAILVIYFCFNIILLGPSTNPTL